MAKYLRKFSNRFAAANHYRFQNAIAAALPVPDFARCTGVKLNERVSL